MSRSMGRMRVIAFLAILAIALPARVAAQASVTCSGPLTETRLIQLAGGVAEPRLIQFVNTCGVGFALTAQGERNLRAAGASEFVIQVVRSRGPRPSTAGKAAPSSRTPASETPTEEVRKHLEKADEAFSRLDFDTGRREYESVESMVPGNAAAKDGLKKVNMYQMETTAYLLRTWPGDMCSVLEAPVHCSGPLGEGDLERWGSAGVPEAWLFKVVRGCRVDFTVTPEVEGRLRTAHVTDLVIAAIRRAQPQGSETAQEGSSGRARGFAGASAQDSEQAIETRLDEADQAFALGNYEQALKEYQAVRQLRPGNGRANQGAEKVRKALAAEGASASAKPPG